MITFSGGEGLAERMNALNFLPIIEAETIRGIRKDTAEGNDANGSSFAPYVPPYEKWRVRKGLPVKVTLCVRAEDSLLDTLGAENIDRNNSVISVKSDREKIAEGLSSKRQFMGVSSKTILSIESKLEDGFVRAIQ